MTLEVSSAIHSITNQSNVLYVPYRWTTLGSEGHQNDLKRVRSPIHREVVKFTQVTRLPIHVSYMFLYVIALPIAHQTLYTCYRVHDEQIKPSIVANGHHGKNLVS
jgi:hypothetical protein